MTERFREIDGIPYFVSERYPRVGDSVLFLETSENKVGKIIRKVDDGLFDIEVTGIKRTIPREWITVVDEIDEPQETIVSLTERIDILETRLAELERLVSYE